MSGPFSTQLHTRLVVLAIAAVLPAVLVIANDQAIERSDVRARTLNETVRMSEFAAAQQSSVLSGTRRFLDTMSQFPGLRAMPRDACGNLLQSMVAGHPGFVAIRLIDRDGMTTCASNPAATASANGYAWFHSLLGSRSAVAGEYQIGRVTHRPGIVVAVPMLDASGAVDHVLAAGVDAQQLEHAAAAASLPERATVTLFDRNGTIVARHPHGEQWVGHRLPVPVQDRLRSHRGPDMLETEGVDGITRLYVTVPVDAGFDTGLFVGVGIDRSVMFADSNRLLRRQLAWLSLVVFVALAVAVVGGRIFVKGPVDTLTAATDRIARGDFTARAQLTAGGPGLVELETAINAMAVALEARDRDRAGFAERLKASAEAYRLLFERNPQPMWVYDVGTLMFLAINDAAVLHYGYTREEFLAMRITDIRPLEDVPAVQNAVVKGKDAPRSSATWRHRLKSGAVRDVEVISHPITFGGHAARLVLAADVTERLSTEQALHDTQERMRFALNASRVGVWEADLRTDRSYFSDICEMLHGLAPGSFGQNFDAFVASIHSEDRSEVRNAIERAIRQRADLSLHYRTVWPDGTEHRLRSSAHFEYDEQGVPVRGAGVVIDVSEQWLLEEQLRQSQKMEAVGQLAGGIAHDFNNMLTAILGNAELLRDDLDADDPHRQITCEIVDAGQRAARLTHQLLAFGRKQMLSPRVIHLGDIVGDLVPMLRRVLGETIDLRTTIGDGGVVKADAGQIEQVLMNLAVNARDAMPHGGRLIVETSDVVVGEAFSLAPLTVADGPYVVLMVTDTGVGMDGATQKRIFEPFFTTKPKDQGSGLGLATVYGIVKQSGGHIAVQSAPGRGTKFTVYLPRTDERETPAPAERAQKLDLRGHETILLVEDESIVREFASKALTQYGYSVIAAAQPTEAIRLADTHQGTIDMIVTDVVLPEMSGRALAERLQARRPTSKVLYVSGYTDAGIVHDGEIDSDINFLPKPFTARALVGRIRDVLNAPVV